MPPERTLIIGDIHGNLHALETVLEKANYNLLKDRIICIGDYIDGWDDSFEVVEKLIKIQQESPFENIFLLGNHDQWLIDALNEGMDLFRDENYTMLKHRDWMYSHGLSTYKAYLKKSDEQILNQKKIFFDQLKLYHIEDNKLFVHAGFDHFIGFEENLKINPKTFIWDRTLFRKAMHYWELETAGAKVKEADKKIDKFDKIYIGHTPTTKFGLYEPKKLGNIINVDQGCKLTGTLSIWVDETDSFFQSV